MTHADRVREAERAVLDRAVTESDEHGGCGCLLCEVVQEWRELSDQTCPDCGGLGRVWDGERDDKCDKITDPCPNPRCVNGAIQPEVKPMRAELGEADHA